MKLWPAIQKARAEGKATYHVGAWAYIRHIQLLDYLYLIPDNVSLQRFSFRCWSDTDALRQDVLHQLLLL